MNIYKYIYYIHTYRLETTCEQLSFLIFIATCTIIYLESPLSKFLYIILYISC